MRPEGPKPLPVPSPGPGRFTPDGEVSPVPWAPPPQNRACPPSATEDLVHDPGCPGGGQRSGPGGGGLCSVRPPALGAE